MVSVFKYMHPGGSPQTDEIMPKPEEVAKNGGWLGTLRKMAGGEEEAPAGAAPAAPGAAAAPAAAPPQEVADDWTPPPGFRGTVIKNGLEISYPGAKRKEPVAAAEPPAGPAMPPIVGEGAPAQVPGAVSAAARAVGRGASALWQRAELAHAKQQNMAEGRDGSTQAKAIKLTTGEARKQASVLPDGTWVIDPQSQQPVQIHRRPADAVAGP
jgi:hypothetical protein